MPADGKKQQKGHDSGMSMYVRFMAMIATGTVVMFVLMYFNTYSIDHVFWSETRFWICLLYTSPSPRDRG